MKSLDRRVRSCCIVAVAMLAGCPARPVPPPDATQCALTFRDVGEVRVFAIGHRFTLDDAQSYESYEASFRADTARIAPCFSTQRPNVVVFPEDAGLIAWFIGSRALLARNAHSSGDAFMGIYAGYNRQSDHFSRKYPGISPARALTLALSDTAWRAVEQTFGGIARRHGVWVVTSANLPVSELRRDDPDTALLRDPAAPADPAGAYIPLAPEVFNTALLYGPDGVLRQRIDKVFLTDPEEQQLDLSNGRFDRFAAFALPFGTFGSAISRDAFYAPISQRMEDLGVEVMLQPEAFSGWSAEEHPGDWLPDVILASGWSQTQKYRGLRFSVAPMLTGNLLDLTFDGQVWISQQSRPEQPLLGFVGSETTRGWNAIGAWAFEDPGLSDPSLSLVQRRTRLRTDGLTLLPNSGSPNEGRYASTVVGADLALSGSARAPEPHPVAAMGDSMPIAAAPGGNQFDVEAAYDEAGMLFAAWTDDRDGHAQVYVARSADDGATWSIARAIAASPAVQRRASIAAHRAGHVIIAWQEGSVGEERIRVAASIDALTTSNLSMMPSRGGAQWQPSLFARTGSTEVALAWADFESGAVPRVRFARSVDGGASWTDSMPVDATTVAVRRLDGTQLQPTLAWAGRWAVGWLDYRTRDWQVRTAFASATNDAFEPSVAASTPSDREVLASDPQLATNASGDLALAWDDLRNRQGHHDVRAARWNSQRLAWDPLPLIEGGVGDGVFVSRFRPGIAGVGSEFRVVFQDLASGRSAVSGATFGATGSGAERVTASRIDDAAMAANRMTRPRIIARRDGTRAVVLFEDDRDGWTRLRAVAR